MRGKLQCANFAHGVAAVVRDDKNSLRMMNAANIAIVSSYNDMLSAHQPYEHFPEQIKKALREIGSVGQFAGGVPAMCDGVTQGEPGMELSIASREVIAMATAVALSHNMFDGALMLGICDKIVPGLLMGSLRFGHLPTIFVPGGPMVSGISNKEKADVRQRYAEGKATREELLDSEMKSYHGPGTCTFYGTANTNQLLMEVMGLHLPGASFVNPVHTATRCPDTRGGVPGDASDQTKRRLHPSRRNCGRTFAGQLDCCPARDGRFHQPHAAHASNRPVRGHPVDLAGHGRSVGSRADPVPRLPERQSRHQPLPGGRRHVVPDPRAARRGPDARRRQHGHGPWLCAATPRNRSWKKASWSGEMALSKASTKMYFALSRVRSRPRAACGSWKATWAVA